MVVRLGQPRRCYPMFPGYNTGIAHPDCSLWRIRTCLRFAFTDDTFRAEAMAFLDKIQEQMDL